MSHLTTTGAWFIRFAKRADMCRLKGHCKRCGERRRLHALYDDYDIFAWEPTPRTHCEACIEGMAEDRAERLQSNGFLGMDDEREMK